MRKKNLFKEMLKKQEKNEIEVGSKEQWILYWLDVAHDDDYYNGGYYDEETGEEFSHEQNLRSILEGCKDLDEMENEIICYSYTDQGYSNKWREDRIKEQYDIKDNNRDEVIKRIMNIDSNFNYFKKINCDKSYIEDQITNRLVWMFEEYYVSKDMFREFKDYFNKWVEGGYNYNIHVSKGRYESERKMCSLNISECKKAAIDFKFDWYGDKEIWWK